jgi:hypothetical protein
MQQTHQLRSAALSAFRASASSLRAPANKRFFTPSAYNMAIKSYFDVQWEGPEVEVDKSGNVTSKGAAKSKFLLFPCPSMLTPPCLHAYSFTPSMPPSQSQPRHPPSYLTLFRSTIWPHQL